MTQILLLFTAVLLASCNTAPNIVKKDHVSEMTVYGTHSFTFDIHLENIGNSEKISGLVTSLIYDGRNFDEYIDYREKSFIDSVTNTGNLPVTDADGNEFSYQHELIEKYSITFHNDLYMIYEYDSYSTGNRAAHGDKSLKYFIIDLSQEELLGLDDLINQVPDNLLRWVFQTNHSINYFLRDDIWPPDTINFNSGAVELLWNTYTLAPYNEGIIKLAVPDGIADQYLTNRGRILRNATLVTASR